MSLNSSSSNSSLPPSSSTHELLLSCINSTAGVFNVTAFTIIIILLLVPLCIFVLYLGHQRWRQQRSGTTTSHSDVFTYNMAVLELLGVAGVAACCCGVHVNLPQMVILGMDILFISFFVQMFFHTFTCVERYLAVVHPVTYLDLKKANWIRYRNITIVCVWLLGFAAISLMTAEENIFFTSVSCFVLINITVICFCSVSVLCVLIRPGPGKGGGDRQHVDPLKLRAFYTIMAIMGVLMLRFGWDILITVVYSSRHVGETRQCGLLLCDFWISLPSNLVLPLLFLHRAGKLPCCKNSNTTSQ